MSVLAPTDIRTLPQRAGSLALDQWRGLALILVLISHGFFFTNRVNGIGRVGVNLFFFISGILVYRSLTKKQATDSIGRSLNFWKGRLWRLYPALLGYAAVITLVVWFTRGSTPRTANAGFDLHVRMLIPALTYTLNFYHDGPMALGHLWSLSCEMQFYVAAPLLFIAADGSTRRQALVYLPILGFVLLMGIVALWFPLSKYETQFAVWPMMTGYCCEWQRWRFQRWPEGWVTLLLQTSIWMGAACILITICLPNLKPLVIATGTLLLLPCFLAYVSARSWSGFAGDSLGWIGKRTYSIYLWQQPLTICRYLPDLFHPVGALASIPIGALWFHWLERPFLSGRRKNVLSP